MAKKNRRRTPLEVDSDYSLEEKTRVLFSEYGLDRPLNNLRIKNLIEKLEQNGLGKKELIEMIVVFDAYAQDERAVDLLEHLAEEVMRGTFAGTEARQLARIINECFLPLEQFRDKNWRGVEWAYQIMENWEAHSADFIGDLFDSFEQIIAVVNSPGDVQHYLQSINILMANDPSLQRFNQFKAISEEILSLLDSCLKKNNLDIYKIGKKFRKKAYLGSYPEVLQGLAALPPCPPAGLVALIRENIEDITVCGKEVIGDSISRNLAELMKYIFRAYEADENLTNKFLDNFDYSYAGRNPQEIASLLKSQIKKLAERRRRPITIEVQKDLERIRASEKRIEEKDSLYFTENYRRIERKLGQKAADDFERVYQFIKKSPFKNIRLQQFTDNYCRMLLGLATEEEKRYLAPIIYPLTESAYLEKKKEINLEKVKRIELKSSARKKIKEQVQKITGREIEMGQIPKFCYDLRHLQSELYSAYNAIFSYQALVDSRFDEEAYGQLLHYLTKNDLLDKKIVSVGAACGVAKKERFIVEELKKKGYDISAILVDKNPQMGGLAALSFIENGLFSPFELAVTDWDLEKASPHNFEKYKEFFSGRQALVSLYGGTPFNLLNIWGMFSMFQELFSLRTSEGPGEDSVWSMVMSSINPMRFFSRKSRLEKRAPGARPDLLITEGDTSKNLAYYYNPNSIDFINYGITEGYKISPENLALESPVFIIDDNKVQSFYLIRQGHQFHPAILIVDSGVLNQQEFDCWMKGVGFENSYLQPKGGNALFAISRICQPDKAYEEKVKCFIKSLEEER